MAFLRHVSVAVLYLLGCDILSMEQNQDHYALHLTLFMEDTVATIKLK